MNKHIGGIVAAENVNFSVQAGEIGSMIGPNGAGKSTLIAMPRGILPVESGQIFPLGEDVANRQPFERVRLGAGLTFQTNRVFHGLIERENLEIPKASADPRDREDRCRTLQHSVPISGPGSGSARFRRAVESFRT